MLLPSRSLNVVPRRHSGTQAFAALPNAIDDYHPFQLISGSENMIAHSLEFFKDRFEFL
jgi:hypothetical protein